MPPGRARADPRSTDPPPPGTARQRSRAARFTRSVPFWWGVPNGSPNAGPAAAQMRTHITYIPDQPEPRGREIARATSNLAREKSREPFPRAKHQHLGASKADRLQAAALPELGARRAAIVNELAFGDAGAVGHSEDGEPICHVT